MSWDVMIYNTHGVKPPSISDFQESDTKPLGPAAEVRNKLSSLLPGIDWSEPTWGVYDGDGFSIEFNVGKDDPITSMMLHVRGGGDAISAIAAFVDPMGCVAIDCSSCDFLELDHISQPGWENFQAYRDKVIQQYREKNEG